MGIFVRLFIRFWELLAIAAVALWELGSGWLTAERLGGWWDWFAADPGHNFLVLVSWAVTIYTIWQLAIWSMQTLYQLHWAKKLVALKITQPRQETEKDRQEAVEKDFREKIGVMEQLYRSMHELSDLNLGNLIRSALFHTDLVSFELQYTDEKINFYVVTNRYYQNIIEKQITSFYPDAYVEPVPLPDPVAAGQHAKAFSFHQEKEGWRPFKTYKSVENDPLNSMTNIFSKLKPKDRATIQIVIRPEKGAGLFGGWQKTARKELNDELLKKKKSFGIPGLGFISTILGVFVLGRESDMAKLGSNQPGASEGGDHYVVRDQATDENFKHAGEKITQPGFETVIRVVGASDSADEAEQITNGIVSAFGMYKNEFLNGLQNRRMIFIDSLNNLMMLFNFRARLPAQGAWPVNEGRCLLVPEELASIYHIPVSRYNYTPLIEWLKYKVLAPPVNLPPEGVVLGVSKYRGEEKTVRIKPKDRLRHFYLIGKSGSGKSVLISSMARQDIANGDGVCVVDPHGDLIEDILNYIPKERAKDVVLFDPGDQERPMGLNLLEASSPEQKDFASLAAMEIFLKLFGNEIFGPRLQHYFRNGALTLMDDEEEGATIIDIPRLFTDDEFQKLKVAKVKNPVVRSFWENEMQKTGQREKEEMIPYFSSKFGPFITNTMMRNIIGQTKSAFDFRKIMDERKILLVNLSKGKVGDLNAQLLGMIFVNKINMAAMSRVDVPEDQRPNFWLYVDEFQNFATSTFATILSEARKYHLGLIIAHQYIGQLTRQEGPEGSREDPTIRDAVFGNVGSMMNFKIGAADAEYMAKEYAPLLSEQDVINIANYSAYVKLNIDNTTSRPFSMSTVWDETGKNEKMAQLVKEYSRTKYGRKKEFVDAEINARLALGHADIPADPAALPTPELAMPAEIPNPFAKPVEPIQPVESAAAPAFTPIPNETEIQPQAAAPAELANPQPAAEPVNQK